MQPLWRLALDVHPNPSTLSITTGLQSSEYKDVSIGPGLHPQSIHPSIWHWISVYKGKVEIA